MAKRFCQNCGHEIEENAMFCQSCGAKLTPPQQAAAPAQPQPQPQQYGAPAQQYYAQQPTYQQPQNSQQQYGQYSQQYGQYPPQYGQYSQQYGQYPYGAPKQKSKKGAVIGVISAAALVILAVVLIIVFVGGPGGGGAVLKNYKYSDILGDYDGTIKVSKVKFSGDAEAIKSYLGATIDEIEGKTYDCSLTLESDTLDIACSDLYYSPSSIYDFEFKDGVYKYSNEDSQEGFGTYKESYEITLHKGKKSDYRIYGVIKYIINYDTDSMKGSVEIDYIIDCEYAG